MSKSSIAMVVLDWAGTIVDHGSLAPVRTLQAVFAARGIDLADEVARRDMGLAKRDHIRRLLAEPEMTSAWFSASRPAATEADVDALYAEFLPLQTACLLDYAQLIEGVLPVAEELREREIRIGGTTGYTRPMLEVLEGAARAQGFAPERSLCPEDVGAGRPHPFMCYQLAVSLRAAPLWASVKVGDTVSDIEEGRNAGMWTVALSRSGNMTGLSAHDWQACSAAEKAQRLSSAEIALRPHSPHFIIASIADLLPVLHQIEIRLASGQRP